MNYFFIGLILYLPAMAQPSLEVRYLIRFNDDFDRGRTDRLHSGYLITGNGRTSFLMVARSSYKPKDDMDIHLTGDTSFKVMTEQQAGLLYSSEEDITGDRFWVSDSLYPMQWTILDGKKQIGELTTQQATCWFRGRRYEAWFAPEIPISAGPWKMGGLPGLIVELEDDRQHMVVRLEKISATEQLPVLPDNVRYDWATFASKRRVLIQRLKEGSRAIATGDCISCQQESELNILTWETYN
jgi:hypothetical protein